MLLCNASDWITITEALATYFYLTLSRTAPGEHIGQFSIPPIDVTPTANMTSNR